MKTKTKKGIFYLGFAFLLCLNSFFPCILIENTALETDIQEKNRLRLSSQNINIITPENKTYIGGMQGYYPATYGFEHDVDGSNPIGWILGEPIDTSVQVNSELDGHKKILELYDNSNTQYLTCHNTFLDKTSGTIEFYFRVDDGGGTDNIMHFMLNEGGSHIIWLRYLNGGLLYRYPGGWESISLINIDTWYYVRIDFECDAGGYKGLSADKVDIYINDVIRVSDGDFTIPSIGVNTLVFATDNTFTFNAFHCYIDAVGYSWDPYYDIGDNLNEGLLLSFTSNTNLDWIGYSIDGLANKTIYGNTTISTPSDGIHNIQLFGNDTMGLGYYSDIRWFKVEEFSDTYTEDFTTTIYMDDSYTDASGWGSGALNLPDKNLTISVFDNPCSWRSKKVQISGDIVYSANYNSFEIYDISNHSELNVLSSYPISTEDYAISGNYAYIAGSIFGLFIIDISNKLSPFVVGSCDNYHVTGNPNLYATSVVIKDSYAYLWDVLHGLIVINVLNPSNPFKAGSWNDVAGFYGERMIIKDDYLFLITESATNNLIIFNINSPTSPTDIYTYHPGIIYDTGVISGNYLYLAGQYTLDIYNIITPSSPSLVSSTSTGVYGIGNIALDNNLVYVAGERLFISPSYFQGRVEIYDVSNVASPQFEYTYISPCSNPTHDSGIDSIDVINGFSFMTDYYGDYLLVDFNLIDQYNALAIAQSSSIYTGTSNVLLTHVLLEVSEDLPPDTGITYYLSADNGIHWEQVMSNSIHTLEYVGNQLKWKALLTTSHLYQTPELNSLSIAYLPLINGSTLVSPSNYAYTSDNTPYFEWVDIPEATGYIIQLDTSTNFSSCDYRYQEVSNNYWTVSPYLRDDTWYWRVAGIDSKNDAGFFSPYNVFYVDAPPGQSILISPVDSSYIATSNPTFTWSEADCTLNYTLQIDSSNTFNTGDLIIHDQILSTSYSSISPIIDGRWYWRIQAFDDTGNSGPFSTIKSFIVDTILPSIDQPNDKSYKEGSTGNGITWNPSDIYPDRCEVTRDGTTVRDNLWDGDLIIIDTDGLSTGIYLYTCTVYDKAGNSNIDSVTVRVEEAENIFEQFIGVYITLGVIGAVAIPVIYIALKKFRTRPSN